MEIEANVRLDCRDTQNSVDLWKQFCFQLWFCPRTFVWRWASQWSVLWLVEVIVNKAYDNTYYSISLSLLVQGFAKVQCMSLAIPKVLPVPQTDFSNSA